MSHVTDSGNIIRTWCMEGDGWDLKATIRATDHAAYEKAKGSLRAAVSTSAEQHRRLFLETLREKNQGADT